MLELLEVKRYKIGSGDVSNFLLIEKIAQTKKEIIISSGLSSLDDLDLTIKKIQDVGLPYSVLQCTSKYPTEAQDIGLGWLNQFHKRYKKGETLRFPL